ncbi:sensor histidine kinase [Blautia schinkii]|uniref:histidine kinase n=1 Tax=Blautia schinkii TaxID=180164 RepID=UPI00156D9C97|nr:histidine kinase [Blautia schinkii]NSG83229.1 sensor histidine kinase [Blautia schinkii]NSK23835.1 sensor histidine kinase [Blautia schinkii]NSK26872.1 sensor histidine kinase [Blautia schinkii]NSK32981.1 sensor histidine kinase [Blautia schinkii]NSK49333.1 sensor histidine kinase [Blautia schinkii]
MRYFTDSILLLLYSTLTFFYVPADQALVFAFLFAVILGCVTYLCRACKTESNSHYFLSLLKCSGNIIPVLAGSYVIFGLCSLWFSDLLLFFPLLLYQTLSSGLFLLAAAELPFWGFLVFQINDFPAVLCILGILGFVLSFFLWLYAGKYQALYQDFHQIRDDSEEHTLLLSEKNKALLEKQDYEIYAATLRERNRIAREIHDNVGHVLSRSILMTAACKTINKDEALAPLLENLEASLNDAMNSIRSSVHDFHDDAVDLEDAIKGLVKDFTFCPIALTYDMSRQVPREVKYSLISITKEGLSNVMRHSNADSVNILLREHPALYQLCIEDNGTSGNEIPDIQTESDSDKMNNISDGMGLSNIRDRVKSLGGTVQITQEKGFRIFVTIPKSVSN